MELKKSKNVDQLFEEIKDYDLVLTTEPSLADSLNARIEEPRLGKLAYTPRKLVFDTEGEAITKVELINLVREETGESLKRISFYLEKIMEAWKKTGKLERLDKFNKFDNKLCREIRKVLKETSNINNLIKKISIPETSKVAVIGEYQFEKLDRIVLPEEYDKIDFFEESSFNMENFYVFNSYNSVIQATIKKIKQEDERDVAVVTSKNSMYDNLLRSCLDEEKIDFMHQGTIGDSEEFRDLFSFLELVISDELLVKECFGTLKKLGLDVKIEDSEKMVYDLDIEGLEEIKKFRGSEIRNVFLLDTFRDSYQTKEFLKKRGLLSEKISEKTFSEIRFWAENYPLKDSKKSMGLMLVEPCSVANIDRSVVIHLGMDSEWDLKVENEPWIDEEKEEIKKFKNFLSMIQSGEQTYFFVQNKYMNEYVSPCLYLTQICGFERFSDSGGSRINLRPNVSEKGFGLEDVREGGFYFRYFSKSSLETFYNCPKDFMFDRLVDQLERDYFTKGTVLHDFAEFYVHFPKFSRENFGKIKGSMIERLNVFYPSARKKVEERELEVGMKVLMEYIDSIDISESPYKFYEKDERNFLSDLFGKDLAKKTTEMKFYDREHMITGIIDLLVDKNTLIDFKSGNKKTSKSLVMSAIPEIIEEDDTPNFQALMYLFYHSKFIDGRIVFKFSHFLEENMKAVKNEEVDSSNIETCIFYEPMYFRDFLCTERGFEEVIGDVNKSNRRRKTLERGGFKVFKEFFGSGFDEKIFFKEKKDILESDLAEKMKNRYLEELEEQEQYKKGVKSALKKIADIRQTTFFKDDTEMFGGFISRQHSKIRDYIKKGFPTEDISDETDLKNEDLVLRGDAI